MKPHEYEPDWDLPAEADRLSRPCKCGLPKRNQIHSSPSEKVEDVSDRILGEGNTDAAAVDPA
jgi:hypothetical protein